MNHSGLGAVSTEHGTPRRRAAAVIFMALLVAFGCAESDGGGNDSGPAAEEPVATNSPPVVGNHRILPSSPYTDDQLTVSGTVSDPDGDLTSSTYSWYVNGALVAVGQMLPSSAFDKGDRVYVEVVATDGQDQSPRRTTSQVVIRNSPPSQPTSAVLPLDAVAGQDSLQCHITIPSTDVDLDAVSYAMHWKLNGEDWTGDVYSRVHTGDTISGIDVAAGQHWECEVTPNDGQQDGAADRSAATVPHVVGEIEPRVAVATSNYCTLDEFGVVACAGRASTGIADVPDGVYVDVDVTSIFACGIRLGDRHVRCWGTVPSGNPPPDGEFARLELGYNDACGLRLDGRLECWWGNGPRTLLDVSQWDNDRFAECGVRDSGDLFCWGNDEFDGVLPSGTFEQVSVQSGSFLCALDVEGQIECVLPEGESEDPPPAYVQPPPGIYQRVETGSNRACGLLEDGELTCWGNGFAGTPSGPPIGEYTQMDFGGIYGCARRVDGRLVCWGLVPPND